MGIGKHRGIRVTISSSKLRPVREQAHHQRSKQGASMSAESTQRDDTWSTLLQSVANTRDREAFQKLFEHFAPLVKGFCLSKPVAGQSSNLADEVVQEKQERNPKKHTTKQNHLKA